MTTAPLVPSSANRVFAETPIDVLGEAIATLAARIHAATYELLVLLREFDARAGWNTGFLSCAHWLHWRTGLDLGASREKVRVSRALADLPRISAAMQRGVVSYAKVRALTRVATQATEQRLLDVALAGTAAQVERVVRAWRRVDRVEAAQQADARHLGRELSLWVDDDGMVVLRARLSPEAGAIVQRALQSATDQLLREAAGVDCADASTDEVTSAPRRADALARVAEAALACDLEPTAPADRYQVVLHVDATSVEEAHGVESAAMLEVDRHVVDVSAEMSRRLACDASRVVVQHAVDGSLLNVGRKSRVVPTPTRRALVARDRGCRFPGCTSRHCDAHHIEHWADGGGTNLDNLMLLCRRHHRLVHEGGFSIVRHDGGAMFLRPDGTPLELAPLPQPAPSRGLRDLAVEAIPVWDGAVLDVAWAIDVLRPQPAA